jgi:ligand-binding sensor domain-containing protein/DNA-binding CsgD family transcriptional regulator
MKKIIFMIVFCRGLLSMAAAQPTIGLPAIKNYKSADYNAATEIWDVKQDKQGILYYANNDGLLTFDGSYWKLYPMPNKTPLKSLAIDDTGRIYVGGQDDLGYFFPNANGILKFHSLKHLLPEKARQFADIWNIVIAKNEVFFRTVEAIFHLKNNKIRVFDTVGGWRMLSVAGTEVFAVDRGNGLMVFKDGEWRSFNRIQTLPLQINGILDYKDDTLLVSTAKNGLYNVQLSTVIKKNTQADNFFHHDLINCSKKIAEDRYAIGTSANGLFIMDQDGRLIQRFSTAEGLQNSNVLGILSDRDRNIWLGLENGLSFINYNTAIKHIYPVSKTQNVSNAIRIFDGKLYIGTSNGLYSTALDLSKQDLSTSKEPFIQVENTRGEVFSLNEISQQLLVAHQEGAHVIRGNTALPVMTKQGVWALKPFPPGEDIIAGTYTGLELLKNINGNLKDAGKIDGIYESLSNISVEDRHTVWASHPFRGVYRIQISAGRKKMLNVKNFTTADGLPSKLHNHVYLIRNKILVTTEKGIYEYDKGRNTVIRSSFYESIFNKDEVEYLTEDAYHNIWFVSNHRVGVIDFNKRSGQRGYLLIYFPELTTQAVKGDEFIYPYNDDNIFIGSNDGVFHLNYNKYVTSKTPLKVLLSSVQAIAENDSLIFGGYFSADYSHLPDRNNKRIIELPNSWNSFHFEYSSTLSAQNKTIDFSYKLTGFDKTWSDWSPKTEKDYTNLSSGTYTFSIRARNNLGNVSPAISYTFIVNPAWYETTWAYLSYLILAACLIYALIIWQKKRFALHQRKYEEEQAKLNYLHNLELDRNEKEIITLQKENLEAELQFKNKELATLTMHLVERGGMLLNIKQALLTMMKKTSIPDPEHEFRSVFRILDEIEKKADDWSQFAIYFDQVHNNFLSTLKAKYPNLSSTDLKLCAYLRLNLSSKEVAQLMNISLKGVEISRYRIRKKLELSTEINLYDFLISITRNTS